MSIPIPYLRAGLEQHLQVLRTLAEEAWIEDTTPLACAACYLPTDASPGCACTTPVPWPLDLVIRKLAIELMK